jgi:hypothetical protein
MRMRLESHNGHANVPPVDYELMVSFDSKEFDQQIEFRCQVAFGFAKQSLDFLVIRLPLSHFGSGFRSTIDLLQRQSIDDQCRRLLMSTLKQNHEGSHSRETSWFLKTFEDETMRLALLKMYVSVKRSTPTLLKRNEV